MSAPSISHLCQAISCHAWNGDKTRVALCPNDKTVLIFERKGTEFTKIHELKEHDQLVTGIDWAPSTNRIVTCGQDRNAYVWRYEDDTWKPTLVILRINRAATHVKWSPKEDKFAVASGAKCVSVCYFEKDNDWWVSKHLKKHKSTVLTVDWHPNNVLLLTASSDFYCRVFSGFIRGVDKKPGETPFGQRLPFGELLAEYPGAGWVHAARWSPDGSKLAFASHDSTISVIDVSGGAPGDCQVIKINELPLTDIMFVNENTIVGCGHNFFPRTFVNNGGTWGVGKNLDEQKAAVKKQVSSTRSAFNMFQSKVETGQNTKIEGLKTKHQNFVNSIQGSAGNNGSWTQVSTTGLDGKLIMWTI